MIVDVYIEGERLDLFEDESINVVQSVTDVKDISKIYADYSQSFHVPASKRNNRIFKNYYNVDIDNGFDARTRKDGVININTLPFKTGGIRLDGVALKDKVPASYRITFFGKSVNVKDKLGDDKLGDLEWLQNFNHSYSSTLVKQGLQNGIDLTADGVVYEKAVIYPLISYTRQYYYNTDPTDNIGLDPDREDTAPTNIAYDTNRVYGVDFRDLKPAIKLELVIKAIEKKYGFNFIGGFFESQRFKDIYINLNNSTDYEPTGLKEISEDAVSFTTPSSEYNIRILRYSVSISPIGQSSMASEYKLIVYVDDVPIYETPEYVTGNHSFSAQKYFIIPRESFSGVVRSELVSKNTIFFNATTTCDFYLTDGNDFPADAPIYPITYSNISAVTAVEISRFIKDINVYEFLTGVFKTFNLVVEARGDDILIEDLQTWYMEGNIYNITPYVDSRVIDIDKGDIYNSLSFKFSETEQILADNYRDNYGKGFGDEETQLYEDETEEKLLDGDSLEIESVFEHVMFERLIDSYTGTETNIQYGLMVDKNLKGINGNPVIFYANRINVADNPIGYSPSDDIYQEINGYVFMPTNNRNIAADNFMLSFYDEFSEYTGNIPSETIYSMYWDKYISDIFSIKRRMFKVTARLPDSLKQKLRLNDRLVIENTRFLINKVQSNLTNGEDKIELINDIYTAPLASDMLSSSLFEDAGGIFEGDNATQSVQYIGLPNQMPTLIDTGDGVGWITIDSYTDGVVSTITFTLDANSSGNTRSARMAVFDKMRNPSYIITQRSKQNII